MVDLCPVVKWSCIQMVVWKQDWKKPVYGPKCPVFKWFAKSRDYHLNTRNPVSGIQMVTVPDSSQNWFHFLRLVPIDSRDLADFPKSEVVSSRLWPDHPTGGGWKRDFIWKLGCLIPKGNELIYNFGVDLTTTGKNRLKPVSVMRKK